MKKIIIFICSLSIILSAMLIPTSAQNYIGNLEKDNGERTVKLRCKVDYMINMEDGSVIFEKNADTSFPPASLTKIMTALVVLKNTPNLNKTIVVSEAALNNLAGTGSMTCGLKAGEQMSVYDMLCCLLIANGNDAAAVLVNEVGGTKENFVEMMNSTAAQLGCKNTHFDNPFGFDSPTHKSTAKELTSIALAALKYPAFETIVACNIYNLPATNRNDERQLVNTNYLINPYRVTYYNRYCKGIKEGSSENAGKCLISYASKDGYKYLAVALGGEQLDTDYDNVPENHALVDTNKMFNWAFNNLKYEIVTQEGQFVCSVPANYSWNGDSVRLVAKSEVIALVPQGNNSESVSFEPIDVPDALDAPIAKGDSVGTAKVIYAGQQIGTAELVAADEMKMSVLLYVGAKIKAMTKTKLFAFAAVVVAICVSVYLLLYLRANRIRKKRRELKIVKYNELQQNSSKRRK